jgi:O-acetyl-ADP-ribose deacetylase (regulator of RNase III)
MAHVEAIAGDITHLHVEAIVNAANEQLARGGGVCGAIHRAAGPELALACRAVGGCATGEARITPGFDLPAAWVIHAVGPVWQGGGNNEDALLAGAYRNSLNLAVGKQLGSIAFPAISTGIFGFPLERATRIAVEAVRTHLQGGTTLQRVLFVCFDESVEQVYRRILGTSPA